jgi:hypothetical protein
MTLSVGAFLCLGIAVAAILLARALRDTPDTGPRDWNRDPSPTARELRRLQKDAQTRRARS